MGESIPVCNFPEDKTYILLDKRYRKKLFEESLKNLNCKNYFELSRILNKLLKIKINGGDINYWIDGERLDKRTGKIHPKFMPLFLPIKLLELNKRDMGELDGNVIAYRSGGKGLIINEPVLPIKVTPELDSIVIHLFGDGAAGDFTPSYTQKHKGALNNFIKKLENCFGGFERSIYFTQGKHQLKFPKTITDVLTNYYSISSYRSYESAIPRKMLEREDKKFKLACIISYIVDEGNIRDVISVYSVNKQLISGIKQMVTDCGYNCSKLQFNKRANSYLFTLSTKDIEKFYQDIKELSKEFPTCNLSFKEEAMEFIIKRRTKKNSRDSKVTEKLILGLLADNELSAQDISKKINYAYCTVIHTLGRLLMEEKVKRTRLTNKTYIWNCVEFKEKK